MKKEGGFLRYRESGSRLTVRRESGLVSIDLGPITYQEAHQKAWFNAVPLLAEGRISGRASIEPSAT